MITSWTWPSRMPAVVVRMSWASRCSSGTVRASAVAHAGAQAAHELVDHRGHAALVRDAAFDAFRHELFRTVSAFEIEFVLEVPIAAAAAHGAERSHAAVFLEAAALEQDHLARALVRAGKQAADHRRAGADGQGFGDVAGVADAAVGDDRNITLCRGLCAGRDRRDHRHADAGHDARGADRPGADARLSRHPRRDR